MKNIIILILISAVLRGQSQSFKQSELCIEGYPASSDELSRPAKIPQVDSNSENSDNWFSYSSPESKLSVTFEPNRITGGIGEILTIKGNGYGSERGSSFVSFKKDQSNFYSPDEARTFRYLIWSDTLIRMEMPVAYNGEIRIVTQGMNFSSQDILRVEANVGYRQAAPRVYDYLTDRNDKGGVTWLVHPDYWNNQEIRQAIMDVFVEFRCKTGVNYKLEPLIGSVPLNLGQGKHMIFPDAELAPGIVGYNEWLWYSCILGAQVFYYRNTQLLRFSTKDNWYYGKGAVPPGKSKFRYVLMHELGHAVGLGHVNEFGQTMYPSVTLQPSDQWSMRDTLTSAEVRAASWFIDLCKENTFTACGIKSMKDFLVCQEVLGETSGAEDHYHTEEYFSAYPNPATQFLKVAFKSNSEQKIHLEIQILNVLGNTVFQTYSNESETEIDLTHWAEKGIFFLKVNDLNNPVPQIKKILIM